MTAADEQLDEQTSAGGGADDATAEGGVAEEEDEEQESSAFAAPGAPVDLGDLGELDPASDLGALASRARSEGAPDDSTTTAPPATTGPESGDGEGVDAAVAAAPADCEVPVRQQLPRAGALVFTATAAFDGAPAFVLGFDEGGDGRTTAVAVVAAQGCRLLTTQSHPTG